MFDIKIISNVIQHLVVAVGIVQARKPYVSTKATKKKKLNNTIDVIVSFTCVSRSTAAPLKEAELLFLGRT